MIFCFVLNFGIPVWMLFFPRDKSVGKSEQAAKLPIKCHNIPQFLEMPWKSERMQNKKICREFWAEVDVRSMKTQSFGRLLGNVQPRGKSVQTSRRRHQEFWVYNEPRSICSNQTVTFSGKCQKALKNDSQDYGLQMMLLYGRVHCDMCTLSTFIPFFLSRIESRDFHRKRVRKADRGCQSHRIQKSKEGKFWEEF